jgi:hypothetical protein
MSKYTTIIVWADFMAPGLWIPNPVPNFPHATLAISHESVGLTEELSKKFNDWIHSFWDVYDHPEEFNCEEFNRVGAMLAAELQQFLGSPHKGAPLILFRPQLPLLPETMKKYYGRKDE